MPEIGATRDVVWEAARLEQIVFTDVYERFINARRILSRSYRSTAKINRRALGMATRFVREIIGTAAHRVTFSG